MERAKIGTTAQERQEDGYKRKEMASISRVTPQSSGLANGAIGKGAGSDGSDLGFRGKAR